MQATERFHALDAVRSFALFLGIVLHSTMSFFLPIPAMDNSPSTTLGVSFFVIHIFRMSLFYVIAGFFARLVFHRRGASAFAGDRLKRIVLPMVVGWIILMPLLGAITLWGLTRTFGAEALAGMEPPVMGLPLTHLWFLYYLCIFYVGALALRSLIVRFVDSGGRLRAWIDRVLAAILPTLFAPLLLALPAALYFYFNQAWMPWMGIPTPDVGLMPQLPALIAYGTAFALGWLLHRQVFLLGHWQKRWALNLGLALVLTAICLRLIGLAPGMEPAFASAPAWHRLVYTACYTSAIWFWTFGIIGLALQFFSRASALQRYLADSSYWLYLAHLPVVFLLQVLFMNVNLHWSVKFPMILLITMTILLLSYHFLVRSTFIGKTLNGRKYPRGRITQNAAAAEAAGPAAPSI